jgi:hypothetical protein
MLVLGLESDFDCVQRVIVRMKVPSVSIVETERTRQLPDVLLLL